MKQPHAILNRKWMTAVLVLISFSCVTIAAEPRKTITVEQAIRRVSHPGGPWGSMNPFRLQVYYRIMAATIAQPRYEMKPGDKNAWRAVMKNQKADRYARLCAAFFLIEKDDEARKFVEQQIKSDDLRLRYNAVEVVRLHVGRDPNKRWGVDLLIRLIDGTSLDGSGVSSSPAGKFPRGDRDDILYEPLGDICWDLGFMEEKQAVDALIKVLKRKPGTGGAAFALGQIGDRRAIPALLQVLKDDSGYENREIRALGKLKSKQAVPILLKRLKSFRQVETGSFDTMEMEKILEALRDIGDNSAIEPIEAFINRDGPKDVKAVARRVLAQLKGEDPVAVLLNLLDKETYEPERSDIVDDLCKFKDVRVVQRLATMGAHSRSAFMRREAIFGLASLDMKASLLSLAELLNAEFPSRLKAEWGWKVQPHFPMYFPDLIAGQLKRRTGKDFGTDTRQWKQYLTGKPQPPTPVKVEKRIPKLHVQFKLVDVLDFKRREARHFAFCSGTRRLFVSHGDLKQDDRLFQWNINTRQLEHTYRMGAGYICDEVLVSPDGKHLVVGCWPKKGFSCKTFIIDPVGKRVVSDLQRTDRIFEIQFNRTSTRFRLFTSEVRPSSDGVVYAVAGFKITKPDLSEFEVPDHERVWYVDGSNGLWCNDAQGRERLLTDRVWNKQYAITADGKFIAATTWKGDLFVWRTANAKQVYHHKHASGYGYLAYDEQHNRFLIGDASHDGTTLMRALVITKNN